MEEDHSYNGNREIDTGQPHVEVGFMLVFFLLIDMYTLIRFCSTYTRDEPKLPDLEVDTSSSTSRSGSPGLVFFFAFF